MSVTTNQIRLLQLPLGRRSGILSLGQKPSEVMDLLGAPTAREDWMGGNLNEAITYPGLLLLFDECDATAPLPDSQLELVQAVDSSGLMVLGRRMNEWDNNKLQSRLTDEGWHVVRENHATLVLPEIGVGFSFDARGLVWVELERVGCGNDDETVRDAAGIHLLGT